MNENNNIAEKENNDGKIAEMKDIIKVGVKIPTWVTVCHEGGSNSINLGSWFMDALFKKELKKTQKEDYEFSEICRNENERAAIYRAIEYSLARDGYKLKILADSNFAV